MHGVIPLLAKPPGNGGGQPHVDEEPHERLGRDHLLAREPGSVSERLLNVLSLQLRVIVENRLDSHPVGNLGHDHTDRDTHSADAGATAHHFGVEGDAIEHGNLQPFFGRQLVGHYQQHGFEEPRLLATHRIQGAKGVGEAEEIGATLLLGLDERAEETGRWQAAGLGGIPHPSHPFGMGPFVDPPCGSTPQAGKGRIAVAPLSPFILKEERTSEPHLGLRKFKLIHYPSAVPLRQRER